jgi:hypothetical protein
MRDTSGRAPARRRTERQTRRQSRRQTLGAGLAALLAATLAAAPAPSYAGSTGTGSTSAYTDFTVSSFNVLGASHTLNSRTYATGVQRQTGVVRLLANHHVDVVGFQEMQSPQLAQFLTLTGGAYAVYPGSQLRAVDGENSIAWRTDTWSLVQAKTVDIPYFDGNVRHMPYVELQNAKTGLKVWFANFHNPATNRSHPRQDSWRMKAIGLEVALANTLHNTGLPVVLTGDMNERQKVFCPMTGHAPMKAARGGTNRDGVCDAQRPWYVDWIFGSKRIAFSGYVEDNGTLDQKTTDHPVIVSDARIDGSKFPTAS